MGWEYPLLSTVWLYSATFQLLRLVLERIRLWAILDIFTYETCKYTLLFPFAKHMLRTDLLQAKEGLVSRKSGNNSTYFTKIETKKQVRDTLYSGLQVLTTYILSHHAAFVYLHFCFCLVTLLQDRLLQVPVSFELRSFSLYALNSAFLLSILFTKDWQYYPVLRADSLHSQHPSSLQPH